MIAPQVAWVVKASRRLLPGLKSASLGRHLFWGMDPHRSSCFASAPPRTSRFSNVKPPFVSVIGPAQCGFSRVCSPPPPIPFSNTKRFRRGFFPDRLDPPGPFLLNDTPTHFYGTATPSAKRPQGDPVKIILGRLRPPFLEFFDFSLPIRPSTVRSRCRPGYLATLLPPSEGRLPFFRFLKFLPSMVPFCFCPFSRLCC